MKDKFTYFDFLVYFIPGTLLIWVCITAVKTLGLAANLKTENVITDSLTFIVLAFILGHFIQFRSKQRTESTIKKSFWSGSLVSEQFLVKNNKFCSEFERQRYIQILREHFTLGEDDIQILEKTDNPEAKKISHSMYQQCFSFITDKGIGDRAVKANEYFNFFRGLSTACVYSGFIFAIVFTFTLIRSLVNRFYLDIFHLLILFLLAIFFCYASYTFRVRASQRGESHVADVFRSVASLFAK